MKPLGKQKREIEQGLMSKVMAFFWNLILLRTVGIPTRRK